MEKFFTLKMILILGILLINYLVSGQGQMEQEKLLKKSKVLACIALTKQRMQKDQKYIESYIKHINQAFKMDDGQNKLISLCLVNCFKKVSQEVAFEIISSIHKKQDLDPLTQENKKLLGLEDKSDSSTKFTEDDFVKDFAQISEILKEMNQESGELKGGAEPSGNYDEDYSDQPSIFSKIIANFIGVSSMLFRSVGSDYLLIGLLILSLYFFVYYIRKILTKPVVKKKKINKNETTDNNETKQD